METIAEWFPNLTLGFSTAVTPINLLYCFLGVFVGTLIGVLPGIGPLAAIAMLLPITFNLPPVGALIMLAGIYYGAQYGGSTTAILVKLPGESASVVTCIDGYEMAKQGRAGPALAVAALGSFFAGTVGTILIATAGPPIAEMALKFGAPEYFSLMVMGLIASAVLAHGSLLKALAMINLGLLFGIVGTDVNSGMSRFAFGVSGLTAPAGNGTCFSRRSRTSGPPRTTSSARGHRPCAAPRSARFSARCRAPARQLPRSLPTRSRRRSPRTPRALAKAPSRASPAQSQPTTRLLNARSFRR